MLGVDGSCRTAAENRNLIIGEIRSNEYIVEVEQNLFLLMRHFQLNIYIIRQPFPVPFQAVK